MVLGLLLFYGGLVQLLAGMWEFKTGNTFGTVAFCGYGGFCMSYAALFIKAFGFLDGYTNTVNLNNDLGIYLLGWTIYTFLLAIAAHRTTVVFMFILVDVDCVFLLLCIYRFTQERYILLQQGAGALGIICAFAAWYAAFATLLTTKSSLFMLPVGEMDHFYRRVGLLPPLIEKKSDKMVV